LRENIEVFAPHSHLVHDYGDGDLHRFHSAFRKDVVVLPLSIFSSSLTALKGNVILYDLPRVKLFSALSIASELEVFGKILCVFTQRSDITPQIFTLYGGLDFFDSFGVDANGNTSKVYVMQWKPLRITAANLRATHDPFSRMARQPNTLVFPMTLDGLKVVALAEQHIVLLTHV